ncbi:MAG: DUF3999 family protein, partial [Rubrivivax sp.]|nr:DUF3999 family protein [Rubrivivax sp.]
MAAVAVGLAGLASALPARAAPEEAPTFRHEAPIVVEQAGAFVRLPLPPDVYAHSRQTSLADLRIIDARRE